MFPRMFPHDLLPRCSSRFGAANRYNGCRMDQSLGGSRSIQLSYRGRRRAAKAPGMQDTERGFASAGNFAGRLDLSP
jgi:hypothetical protein